MKTLGPGWRCKACGYALEGLPDAGARVRCPECGHRGQPVRARTPPPPAARALAGVVSFSAVVVSCLCFGGIYVAWTAQGRLAIHELRIVTAIAFAIAGPALLTSVVVWAGPTGRWRFARSIAALALVALGLGSTLMAPAHWSGLILPLFCAVSAPVVLQWEVAGWLGLRRERSEGAV